MEELKRFVTEWCEESAKNLIRLNIDTEDIMKATGLTEKQIERLN